MSRVPVANLDQLDADALRALGHQFLGQLDQQDQVLHEKSQPIAQQARDNHVKETGIQQPSHVIAVLRRFRFGKKSEQLAR